MDIKVFLNDICKKIKYKPARKWISDELEAHVLEIKENYIDDGMEEMKAEEKAVSQMGSAEDIGKQLNKIHRPHLDWRLLILIFILMAFGLLIASFKGISNNANYIEIMIIYMLIGIATSIFIYLFDYRKLKNLSFLIYLFTTIVMILPMTGLGAFSKGIACINLFGYYFFPGTIAVTLYIIAFIGFIDSYNKNNTINFKIQNKIFSINKDFIKIIGLTGLSLIMMSSISTLTNTLILSLVYLVITTTKIIFNKENRVKNILILYGAIGVCAFALMFCLKVNPFSETMRLLSSFNPEIDPNNTGYIGMLQKEILQNAKLVGEAKTEVISSNNYIITKDSNYTFIYLLGKAGILIAGILVFIIVLTSVKLIINAKNIKEQYGKFLIIGLSTLYIFQSFASVLMNVNMGIQSNINIPFVSYGSIYFIINIWSMAIIFSVYRKKDINFEEPKKSKLFTKIQNLIFETEEENENIDPELNN